MKSWREKKIHGEFLRQLEEEGVDINGTWNWLKKKKPDLKSSTEEYEDSGWLSGHQPGLPPLRPRFHPRVPCGGSFDRSLSGSDGFSPGTLVFLPPQKSTPSQLHLAGSGCSEITHGSYGASRAAPFNMHSVLSRRAGWSWKAIVGSGQLSTFTFTFT